jgi:hypothetical protein
MSANKLTWLQSNYSAVAKELEAVQSRPPIPPETSGDSVSLLIDDVELPLTAQLKADFVPELIALYLESELIFLKAQGEVLLNRLPTLSKEV